MKLGLITLLCLCACGSHRPDSFTTGKSDPIVDAGLLPAPNDAGSDVTVSVPVDAGTDSRYPSYNGCVTHLDSPTAYPRLTEKTCTDSLGNTYSDGYWDSQLQLMCRFRLSCDMKVHCLPENEQSSPEYADEACTKPIAMAEYKNGQPVSGYVGLDQYASNQDAGDAGWYSCMDVYSIASAWKDTGVMYYLSLEAEGWTCLPTYINFLGTKMYYLSANPVNPAMFVEQ